MLRARTQADLADPSLGVATDELRICPIPTHATQNFKYYYIAQLIGFAAWRWGSRLPAVLWRVDGHPTPWAVLGAAGLPSERTFIRRRPGCPLQLLQLLRVLFPSVPPSGATPA